MTTFRKETTVVGLPSKIPNDDGKERLGFCDCLIFQEIKQSQKPSLSFPLSFGILLHKPTTVVSFLKVVT